MLRDLVITVDVGTTALKASVWDRAVDESIASHREEYELDTGTERIECDPEVYLQAMTRGVRAVIDAVPADGVVRALTITTQGETLLLVDRDDAPVGPAIVWLDARARGEADRLRAALGEGAFRRATGLPELTGATPLAKLLGISQQHPDILAAGGAVLLLEDFLLARLTGRRVSTPSLQTSTGWFHLGQDDYWGPALVAAGVDRAHLPELVPSGTAIGPIRDEWCVHLGLPNDVLAVAGGMDQTVAALGAGALDPGTVNITFGSALTVAATVDVLPDVTESSLTVYRHISAGRFLVLEFLPTGAILLAWLRRLLAASSQSSVGYERLDVLAAEVAPGSDGVIALPQFEGGLAGATESGATGGFLGLTLATTGGHLVRSVMESTAYVLREAIAAIEERGVTTTQIRTSGGGSRSTVWQRIVADVCGRDLARLRGDEATSRGAALLACWGAGILPIGTDPAAIEAERMSPDPVTHERYTGFERRYRRAVSAARAFWASDSERNPS